jgi:LytR cell envelope-related transcriptional attenuator
VAAPAVRPQAAPPPAGPIPTPPPTIPSARPAAAPTTPILGNLRPGRPWYRRISRPAPRYIALIVVGILVIGAGAAYGVSKLTNNNTTGGGQSSVLQTTGGGGGGSSSAHHTQKTVSINPKSITVAVLNGTTVTGLAATVADKVEQAGFTRGNTNNALTQGQQAESVVEYADHNLAAAQLVGKKLGITQFEKIDAQTQTLAGDATVTVVVGADKAGGSG